MEIVCYGCMWSPRFLLWSLNSSERLVCLWLFGVGWRSRGAFRLDLLSYVPQRSDFGCVSMIDCSMPCEGKSHMTNNVNQRELTFKPISHRLNMNTFSWFYRKTSLTHMPLSPPLTLRAFFVDHCLCPLCSPSIAAPTPGPSLSSSLIASDINGRWMLANYGS